jgi:hypothetical protein
MRKAAVVITTISLLVTVTAGHWITIPLDQSQVDSAIHLILKKEDAVCDYQKNYGFLVSRDDSKHLENVKNIKWKVVEKDEMGSFMDANRIDYAFHGDIHFQQKGSGTEICIGNWPVVSKRFKGELLCGGTSYYMAYRRLPSLLNLILGSIIVEDVMKIVS